MYIMNNLYVIHKIHREAEIICETDDQCGGFTFKGPKMLDRCDPTGRLDGCQLYI